MAPRIKAAPKAPPLTAQQKRAAVSAADEAQEKVDLAMAGMNDTYFAQVTGGENKGQYTHRSKVEGSNPRPSST